MCRMCWRRIRTHAEWNVAISGARIPTGTTSSSTRRAISPAALLVNVTARTFFGCTRSEEHTSELQSQSNIVCRLLLEKKTYLRTLGIRPLGWDRYELADGRRVRRRYGI